MAGHILMHLPNLTLSLLQLQLVESVQCSNLLNYSDYFFQAENIPRKVKTTNTDCQVPSPPLVMMIQKQIYFKKEQI